MLGLAPPAAEAVTREALELTRSALKRLPTSQDEIYYAFADKTIVPTFLSRPLSRREIDTLQPFWGLRGTLRLCPRKVVRRRGRPADVTSGGPAGVIEGHVAQHGGVLTARGSTLSLALLKSGSCGRILYNLVCGPVYDELEGHASE